MTVFLMAVIQAYRLLIAVPLQVVHHQQIQEAIIVDIHPRATDGPEWTVLGVGFRG